MSEVVIVTHRRNQKRKSGRTQKITTWLRQRTSLLNFGFRLEAKKYPKANTNAVIINAIKHGEWRKVERLSDDDYKDHFDRLETYFFEGNGWKEFPESLFAIDIDCHDSGTLEGATAFARYLKKKFFPGLYFEVSTEGNGIHCYLVLKKQDNHPQFINSVLNQLQAFLQSLLDRFNFDVEMVEVMGTLAVLNWSNTGSLSYTSGRQCKLPREQHRFEQLRNTTKLTVTDIQKLVCPKVNRDHLPVILGGKGQAAEAGSLSLFSAKVLAGCRKVAEALMTTHKLETKGSRAIVLVEDVAIFLMIQRAIAKNMNRDGSNPSKRMAESWRMLKDNKEVARPYDKNRAAAIKRYLSSLSLLDIQDNTYEVGFSVDDDGVCHKGRHQGMRYIKGKAAKWKLSAALIGMIEETIRDRGGALSRTRLSTFIKNLTQLPFWKTICFRERFSPPPYLWHPDEISQFVGFLDIAA